MNPLNILFFLYLLNNVYQGINRHSDGFPQRCHDFCAFHNFLKKWPRFCNEHGISILLWNSENLSCHTIFHGTRCACIFTVLFEYIGPSKWPASSPDLNPVDYSVWNELERVLQRRQSFKTLDDLKAALIEAWEQLPHDHIVNAINKFRQRCRYLLQAEGGHIEHFR